MTHSVTSLKRASELVAAGLVSKADQPLIEDVAKHYAIAIPQNIVARIDPQNPSDPLALQFVPSKHELEHQAHEQDDPIGDELKSPLTGIVHRYPDRALLKLVNVCPIYCRFCFRRESVGPTASNTEKSSPSGVLTEKQLQAALDYLKSHQEIWEVIITGGDPLVLSPRHIKSLNQALATIPHIKVVRWHTRVPVVLPEQITTELCQALNCEGKAVYIGLHTNHPSELNAPALAACKRIIDAGHAMVSQTVLLKGINDNATTMIELMRKLIENRIKPYYLHHTDLAPGTSHFRVSIEMGQEIMQTMRAKLSGLAQPTYVLDIPGAHGKVPIGPAYMTPNSGAQNHGMHIVMDPIGNKHLYNDPASRPQKDQGK